MCSYYYVSCKHVEIGVHTVQQNVASVHKAIKVFGIDRKQVRAWSEKYDELKRYSGETPGKRCRGLPWKESFCLQTTIDCAYVFARAIYKHALFIDFVRLFMMVLSIRTYTYVHSLVGGGGGG